jgi:hypothetical protein
MLERHDGRTTLAAVPPHGRPAGVRPRPPASDGFGATRLLRGQRHVGAFTRWKEPDPYRQALERLLRDLKVEASLAAGG